MNFKRISANIIPHERVKEALKDKSQLFELWQERIGTPPKDVLPLDKQANNLLSEAIKDIITIIKKIDK